MRGAKTQNIREFLKEPLMVLFDSTKSVPIAVFVVGFASLFAVD
jgi:hypothetical protein